MQLVTTDELTKLNAESVKRKFTHTLPAAVIGKLDKKGLHTIDQIASIGVGENYVTCKVLLKMKGQVEPKFAVIDLWEPDFDRLIKKIRR